MVTSKDAKRKHLTNATPFHDLNNNDDNETLNKQIVEENFLNQIDNDYENSTASIS